MTKPTLFFVAGEHSGDQRSASLISELKHLNPSYSFTGLGGRLMAKAGCEILFDLPSIAVLGFTDVLRQYGKFRKIFYDALKSIDRIKPTAIILIDFPGFNIRLAKKIKKRYPVIYYVSPQIWAWAPLRKYTIARYVHKMLTLFKFEHEAYEGTKLDVEWVGHPLVDQLNRNLDSAEIRKRFGIAQKETVVGLLPGSRAKEVTRVLPIMLQAGKIIAQNKPQTVFLLSRSNTVEAKVFEQIKSNFSELRIISSESHSQDVLKASDFAMVCSGTATLEATLLKTPFLIIYKTAYLTYLFARNLMNIPYIGMPNVLARRLIVPEFIQHNAQADVIAKKVLYFLTQPNALNEMEKNLGEACKELGEGNAAKRTAQAIVRFLQTADFSAGASSAESLTAEETPGLPGVSGAVPARGDKLRAGGGDVERSRPLTSSTLAAGSDEGDRPAAEA